MLKINFLLTIRKLKKDKKSFFINLLGSSIGLAAIILMTLYVLYENNLRYVSIRIVIGYLGSKERLLIIFKTVFSMGHLTN